MGRAVSFLFAALVAVGIGLAVLPGANDAARAQGSAMACPGQIGSAGAIDCSCSAEAINSGSIWGDDVYTADSAICRAARHAGAIGANGGFVKVRVVPGRASYAAAERNGVASSTWGSYDRSITFDGSDSADAIAACPVNAGGMAAGGSLTCGCDGSAAGSGSVWGSGPYTTDSSICRAARHAGAIGADGGTVTIRITPGRASYAASERNGVPSNAWGSYGTSFTVER